MIKKSDNTSAGIKTRPSVPARRISVSARADWEPARARLPTRLPDLDGTPRHALIARPVTRPDHAPPPPAAASYREATRPAGPPPPAPASAAARARRFGLDAESRPDPIGRTT